MRLLTLLFLALIAGPRAATAELVVEHICSRNTVYSCFISIDGPIETGAFEKVKTVIQDPHREGAFGGIYLNSRGGNLGEALAIGRFLRDQGFDTRIGRKHDFQEDPFPIPGTCESACAYIFMGGVTRHLRDGDVLGVHRFFAPGRSLDGGTAQQMSGQLIAYMVEMGIDARLFTLASQQGQEGMHHVTQSEAREYDLVTDDGYSALNLEPYGNGVIAWTRPEGPGAPGNVDQVTFYCRAGTPEILFFLENQPDIIDSKALAGEGKFNGSLDRFDLSDRPVRITGHQRGTDAYYTISTEPALAQVLAQTTDASLNIWYPPIVGGGFTAELVFTDTDRAKLSYAFSHCIN
ncbi:MAG: hypothetical protein AB3N11_03065 [Arenibacterium sp.]